MKKFIVFITLTFFLTSGLFAQQKFALVIGNGAYMYVTKLNNPVNDANDMAAALKGLGFTVETVLNGNLSQMEKGIVNLKEKLKVAKNSYGFLFYAGHGVQSNGENYLIPVDANISSENFLRRQAISVQEMLDELNDAGNELNVVVLDACRDNPFPWKRSGNRGLQVVGNQPADSIIVFATSAGSTAADGTGRNGLFTGHLLNNLKTPGLTVDEIFKRTGADVTAASGRQQVPAVYNQFFGTAYLGTKPAAQTTPQSSAATGSISVTSEIAGIIMIDGEATGTRVKAGGTATITNIGTGNTEVAVKGDDGKIIKAQNTVMVRQGQTVSAVIERLVPNNMVRIQGGTFQMGSNNAYMDEKPVHTVTLSGFYMGKYEVTQKEYQAIMGTNPSNFKGDNLPVENVNWYDALVFCNKLSMAEGLSPAYSINNSTNLSNWGTVPTNSNSTWDKVVIVSGSNGYRLPTEAQWEYAARGGNGTPGNYTYSGGNNVGDVAWYDDNSGNSTHAVGTKKPNGLGLYDMSGNVMEWCWDQYGVYSGNAQTDPAGAVAAYDFRMLRGGSWLNKASFAHSVVRSVDYPGRRQENYGFRVVRPL